MIQRPDANPIPVEVQEQITGILAHYYDRGETERRQQRAPLDKIWHTARRFIAEPLFKLFEGKCAYCESPLGVTSAMEIDQFRPVAASDVDGSGSLEHYQWLRLEWANLYPACAACNRAKRGLFPVLGPRAEVGTPMAAIAEAEDALLIDPCRDEPREHLEFGSDGFVRALTERGAATIKILNLDRLPLIEARRLTWAETTRLLAARQVKAAWMDGREAYTAVVEAAQRQTILQNPTIELGAVALRSGVTPADEVLATDREAFRLTQRPIRSIEITNFKLLRDVKIKLPEPTAERAPWLVLLGENASGKSSLLQAIALALAGAVEASALIQPSRVLSRGASSGEVVLRFWDNDVPVKLGFERGRRVFTGTARPSATVRAFGALRHMERRRRQKVEERAHPVGIDQIVRPIARIEYPNRWLLNQSPQRFDVVARALKDLLPIPVDTLLEMRGSELMIRLGDVLTPLSMASAGYQAVIGIAVEIMKMVFEFWDTLDSAAAVVIVDELDAHLHPRWKMRIVSALRTAFPNIQFIVSTHDPLLLRGLRNDETALITRVEGVGTTVRTDLPPIEGMQVDEILTSSVFGLDSTIDPDTEALFDEYYFLIAHPQSASDAARVEELRSQLADRQSLGRNARESLMLAAAQQFLRENREREPLNPERLRPETVQHLREMFADVALPARRT